MKILITGIHGFVGSNLVKYLAPNNTLYGIDIIAPEKQGILATFSWNDLEKDVIPNVDAIIHLAGKAHDVKKQAAAKEYFEVNRDLTIKIFDYFCSHQINKFVFFSTAKAAADVLDGVLTETVDPKPVGPYGESKIAAEQYILKMMADKPLNFEGRGVYIFRPCMIHGPGNKGNLNLLYGFVCKGIPWPLGSFDNKRTFTSVDNICYVVNGVLVKDIPSGIYNIGDDEPLSTNELISTICCVLGKKVHIWRIPQKLMFFLAKVGDYLHLPLNTERLRKLTENYVSSNAKIKTALGVDKMPIDARNGLICTINSFKELK